MCSCECERRKEAEVNNFSGRRCSWIPKVLALEVVPRGAAQFRVLGRHPATLGIYTRAMVGGSATVSPT